MDRLLPPPKVHRGSRLPAPRSNWARRGWLLAILLLAVPVGLTHSGWSTPGAASAPLAGPSAPSLAVHPAATPLGDLIVTSANSPYLLQGGGSNGGTSIVEGNISVAAGATLELRNISLVQEEFVSDDGTTSQRLSHLYTISDEGTISLDHSSLVSYIAGINPYPKIALNVSDGGRLLLNASALEFAGWLTVYGPGSTLNLTNGSSIGPNPLVPTGLLTNATIINDTRFAPILDASGGAQVNLFDSVFNGTYRDNVSFSGSPGPAVPIEDHTTHTLTGGAGATWTDFALTSPDSENLTRAALYRDVATVNLTIAYTSAATINTTGDSIDFGGALPFGPVELPSGGPSVTVQLPADVVSGINNGSFTNFLGAIDSDGGSVTLGHLDVAGSVTVTSLEFNATPLLSYNVTFAGAGTTLTAVDSSFDLNWNLTPGTPVDPNVLAPTPWGSNKLLLEDGAVGYFANVSITNRPTRSSGNASAILTDATSTAVFYRWFDAEVRGANDAPIAGAQATAYFDLNSIQADNATATALNQLGATDPGLAAYVAARDVAWGVNGYGSSDANGVSHLLLASTVLDFLSQPDGNFLGGYHLALTIPGTGPNRTHWSTAAVSPYPLNMTPAGPDGFATPAVFPGYAPSLVISATTLLVDGVTIANATVALGENLTVQETITNAGLGPISGASIDLTYMVAGGNRTKVIVEPIAFLPPVSGTSITVNLTWLANENVTGLNGTIDALLATNLAWVGAAGNSSYDVATDVPVVIVPAFISITFTPPSIPLQAASEVAATGTVHFIGKKNATVNVTAISSTGERFLIGQAITESGPFVMELLPIAGMNPGVYDLNITALYNHRTVNETLPAALTVAGAASTPPTPFLDQTFLGLPLWLWIVVAVAAVVAVIVLLWFLRRNSKGKLVECGECGELIPEAATTCPKCGAEFETDLVRCSRCSSTIPANSTQCPECAAQLLGPETADPVRQAYQDHVEKFRAEARKELGDNNSEGAFWDWWKRQSSYVSFEQWKLQQAQSGRTGMGAPPPGGASELPAAGAAPGAAPKAADAPRPAVTPASSASPPSTTSAPASRPTETTPGSAGPAMKPCASCGKEIPPDYLVCPFCGAVTR